MLLRKCQKCHQWLELQKYGNRSTSTVPVYSTTTPSITWIVCKGCRCQHSKSLKGYCMTCGVLVLKHD